MTESLKVLSTPEQKKQITVGDNVPKIVWAFDVQRATANGNAGKLSVELLLDPGSPPPPQDSTVEGDLEQNQYGWKLKLPRRGGGGGGRPRTSPEERRSIERQVAAKIAAENFSFDASNPAEWRKQYRWLVDEIHAAIRGE